METQIVTIDPARPEADSIAKAGRIIREGGLVAFPTETVYGLGGDALQAESSKKIYAAKGRPSDNPLIVHIADPEALYLVAASVPESAEKLMREFWPGPLTMILEKKDCVPFETTGGLSTAAIRLPSHPVARELIRASGGFIAAPSANLSGRPSPTRAEHVREDLAGRIDMILDGGPVAIGLESTIVDLTEEIPTILRPGYISLSMLEDVLGTVRIDPGILSENEHIRPKAPGMRYRHYAPKAPLLIVEGSEAEVEKAILAYVGDAIREGKRAAVLCAGEHTERYREQFGDAADIRTVGTLSEEDSIARNLYDALRHFDESETHVIYSEAFDTPRLGQAIMNRLLKAAGHTDVQAGR